jgi:predicted DNA-binding protein with PD1-like motif
VQSKLLHEDRGQRTFALILQTGDEAMSCLQEFANRERVAAAHLTAIGAFQEAQIASFDWELKQYVPIPIREQVEVASSSVTLRLPMGSPASMFTPFSVGGMARVAGHLQKGHTADAGNHCHESPAYLRKVRDAESGLALISPRLSS